MGQNIKRFLYQEVEKLFKLEAQKMNLFSDTVKSSGKNR